MDDEPNFTRNKKRRRSSLFVDRRSRMFDDVDAQATQNEPAVHSCNSTNAGDIRNYISNTKQCYKNWLMYQKEVKSKLDEAKNAKPLQFDEKTLMECLTLEDRSFLQEAEDFLERRSQLAKEISSAGSELAALVDEYEFNKRLMNVVYDDLLTLHQATAVKVIEDHQRSVMEKFGGFPTSSELTISNDEDQIILVYDSDVE